jgi:arginase family enzyme
MVRRIRQRVGDRPVYVSVDIGVLDPAHAPGTGTPEAGGHAQITGITAAHVGCELLSSLAAPTVG